MKALVGAFNQEKALVGAFSVIVKTGFGTNGSFYSTKQDYNLGALETSAAGATPVSRTAPDFSLGDGRPQDIAGRTLVVHAEESGGARVACGIITLI